MDTLATVANLVRRERECVYVFVCGWWIYSGGTSLSDQDIIESD